MNRMKKGAAVGAILLATALSVGVGAPAFADNSPIIADGEFSSPSLGTYYPGDNIGAWTVVSGSVSISPSGADGNTGQHLSVNNNVPSPYSVTQSFPTTPGATYQVKYYTHLGVTASNQEDVFINGVDFSSTVSPGVNGSNAWEVHTFLFTASTSNTALTLQSSGGSFDAVAVKLVTAAVDCTVIPTPVSCLPLVSPEVGIVAGSVAALAGLSVGAVFLIRRRQQGSVTSAV